MGFFCRVSTKFNFLVIWVETAHPPLTKLKTPAFKNKKKVFEASDVDNLTTKKIKNILFNYTETSACSLGQLKLHRGRTERD